MTPQRIQRKRTKGWKMPANTVYVGRPTRWGNPHKTGDGVTQEEAVKRFWRDIAYGRLPFTVEDVRRELAGKDLACWCKEDEACHADVLLRIANFDFIASTKDSLERYSETWAALAKL